MEFNWGVSMQILCDVLECLCTLKDVIVTLKLKVLEA